MSLFIRAATHADAGAIAAIHNETIRARTSTMETDQKTPESVTEWLEGLGPREAVLVGEEHGVLVGWGVIKHYSPRPGYRFAGETSVFLRHDVRGRGIGTALKKAVIARARALGYHHLVARIVASNAGSIAYNERLGYELVGIQREAGYLQGKRCDIAVMQLVLG
ncbi:MAG: N-acetyltransferase [Deltaproteobacteria bacterium]|nr:N-acetyltransferase [Deltaproteobacteria bacterium]